MFVSSLNSESNSRSLRFIPAPAAVEVEATECAGETGTDCAAREGAVALLWGRELAALARVPCRILARPVAPVRDGGGGIEDFVALLKGAARLESRAAVRRDCDAEKDVILVGKTMLTQCDVAGPGVFNEPTRFEW